MQVVQMTTEKRKSQTVFALCCTSLHTVPAMKGVLTALHKPNCTVVIAVAAPEIVKCKTSQSEHVMMSMQGVSAILEQAEQSKQAPPAPA